MSSAEGGREREKGEQRGVRAREGEKEKGEARQGGEGGSTTTGRV